MLTFTSTSKVKIVVKTFSFLLIIFLSFTALAGGFQINTQGHKALGMGGAFTGNCTDASSVFFNPAGITSLKKKHFLTSGVAFINPNVSVQTDAVPNTDMTSPVANPIQFYYAFKLNEKLSFGFAINNQFGSTASYPDEWQGKYIVQKLSLKTFMYQPTVAFKLNKYAGFGLGYVLAGGEFEYKKAIPVSNNSIEHGEVNLSGSGEARGFNAGFFAQPFEDVNFGVSYRSKMKMTLQNATAEFSSIPVSLLDVFPEKTEFYSSITLPAVLSAGVSFHPDSLKKIKFSFDVNRTYWSSYDTLSFDFANEKTPDSKVVKAWTNTMTYRFGVSYKLLKWAEVRAGMYNDETPIPDGHVSPELPDNTHTGYTLGLGIKFSETVSADFSWLYSNLKRNAWLEAEGFRGQYHRIISVFGVGLNISL